MRPAFEREDKRPMKRNPWFFLATILLCGLRAVTSAAFPGTAPEAPVVRAISRTVRAQFGVEPKPVGVGGTALAGELRSRGIPVALWAKSESVGNAPNEHISVSALLDASKVFVRMLFDEEAAKAAPVASPTTPKAANGAETP